MIDPATGWFEIVAYDDKRAITVANMLEQTWLCRYPRPSLITYDRGSEFIGTGFRTTVKNEYGIKAKPITVRNPQANAIIERIHQVIANMIRTYELEDVYMDKKDPWGGILAATAYAVRSTYHTTLQATPGQLVFGRDMIFNVKHTANWKLIKERKQKIIDYNNERENKSRIAHEYTINEKVLLLRHDANKYERPYDGPYEITAVYQNGTVQIRKGCVLDTVNIRRLKPFKE
jgi:transposase InsO family protein